MFPIFVPFLTEREICSFGRMLQSWGLLPKARQASGLSQEALPEGALRLTAPGEDAEVLLEAFTILFMKVGFRETQVPTSSD